MMLNEGSDTSDVEPSTESYSGAASEVPSDSSLLMKSREQYQTHYRKFMEWKEAHNKESLTEDVFMDYFRELAEKMKPSTLWSQFSMLKYTMGINDNVDMNTFEELRSFLRTNSVGYKSKSSNVFTSKEIETFLNDAPDSQFLAEKVALIFGIIGACRSHELVHITVNNIEDDGIMALVTIPKTESDPERSFTICGEFYQVYKRYAILRPKIVDSKRFFLSYRNGRCVNQVIGLHKFGGMPKQIAGFMNLPDPDGYTGHTFRRTSAALLASSGADLRTLQQHVGGNSRIARDLIEEKKRNKIRISKQITESVFLKPSTSTLTESSQRQVPVEHLIVTPEQLQSVDDPLFIDCNTTIKEETVIEELEDAEAEAEAEAEVLPPHRQIISTVTNSNVSSHTSAKPDIIQPTVKFIKKPVIRLQSNKKPTNLQNIQPAKRVVVKTIPLKKPPVALQSIVRQQNPPVSQNILPQRSPEICLRWGHHHSNMQTSLPSFLNAEDFVDVTLACEGKSVKCHKVILSSCSEYLASLLRDNPCQHPIILMKDLKFWEVEALVKFMYKGEVNIPHDKLPQLLKAAEALDVKGLAHFAPVPIPKPTIAIPQLTRQPCTSASSPKPSEAKNVKKSSTNESSTSQSTAKRGMKRMIETKKPTLVSKYRRECPKTPPPLRTLSPEIKVESLDIPLGETDMYSVTNADTPTRDYENLVTLNETNDSGGEDPHGSQDMVDVQEDMDLVLTDFFQQETHFLEGINAEASRNSVAVIRANNALIVPPSDHQEHGKFNRKDGT